MAEGSTDTFKFEYDTEKLVRAKTLALYNANLCATAASAFGTIKNPLGLLANGKVESRYDWDRIKAFSESGNDAECYSGEPLTEIRKVDFSAIETAQQKFTEIANTISAFNEEIDRIANIIIENIDPDLAEELENALKDVEKEALKDYLDIGIAGGNIDPVELYKLISKYKDDKSLELDENQVAFLDFIVEAAETAIEYQKMPDSVKAFQTCIVFGVSVVDGVVKVGEEIVDGAAFVAGEASGLGALIFCQDPEMRQAIIEGTFNFIDKDWTGDLYDDFIDMSGLNKNIAYGSAHRVGLAVGQLTGDTLLAGIPGGKAAALAVKTLRAAGKNAQSTAGENTVYREASAGFAIFKTLSSAGVDAMKDGKLKDAVEILQGAGDQLAEDVIEYCLKGETDNPSAVDFVKKHGLDVVKGAVDVLYEKGEGVVKKEFKAQSGASAAKTTNASSGSDTGEKKADTPPKKKTATERMKETWVKGQEKVEDTVTEEAAAWAIERIFGPTPSPTDPYEVANNVLNVGYTNPES